MGKMIATLLSKIYHGLLILDQAFMRMFSSKKVSARVISIGNITWGGTGKTPLVAKLAEDIAQSGKKVAILIRGYGQDEVDELRKKLPNVPVLVGSNRASLAKAAIKKHGSEFLILDDGFQHLRLHRDLDIVNINTIQPFGPGGLLPLGTLREPLEHLSRANIFMLTKSNIGSKNLHWIRQKLNTIKPNAVIFEAIHRPMKLIDPLKNRYYPLDEVKNKKLATVCGIGDPFSFEKTLENLGATILFAARFDDHHPYTSSDISKLIKRCQELGVRDIVTTQKDYMRLRAIAQKKKELHEKIRLLILEIEFQVNDEEDFLRRCLNL